MKEKGPGNSSVRPLSETRKKQRNGPVIFWVKIPLGRGCFLRFPSGSLSQSRELRVTDVYIKYIYFSSRKRAPTLKGTYMFPVA